MMNLPTKYNWLSKEPAPKMLIQALKFHGIEEMPGMPDNKIIVSWAKTLRISWYSKDSIPWCGLFVGIVASLAGYPHDSNQLLAAISWLKWGEKVEENQEMLWDILVFERPGAGEHVGFYVGENKTAFLVYGGNQSDKVGFAWIAKNRLLGARRPKYQIGQPKNVRKIILTEQGELSLNEA